MLAHQSPSPRDSGTPAGPSRDLREAERDRTDGCAFECVGRPGSCRGERVNVNPWGAWAVDSGTLQ